MGKNSRGNIEFAFGSSAPRLIEPRIDSSSGYWGSRSVTGPGMFERSQRSMEREVGAGGDFKAKRTASAQGLDRSTEGEENGIISGSGHTAHRRRTDLVPTIVMARNDGMSRSGTPSTKHRSPGRAVSMSRIDQLSQPRQPRLAPHASNHPTNISPSKSMSHLAVPANKTARRPFSLLTNSTSQSNLHERRARAKTVGQTSKSKEVGTPKADRMKRARSVTSDTGGIEDDNRSTTSSQSVGPTNRTPTRKTPSQVKAEAAARKAKATAAKSGTSTPKSSLGSRGGTERKTSSSKSPSPALSQDNIDNSIAVPNNDTESSKRQSTPDIIKDNNKKSENGEMDKENQKNGTPEEDNKAINNNNIDKEKSPEADNEGEVKEGKKIITSEEEAKARIAEKRREMKEQKEREAELERLRLEEEARLEEERLRQEEEEERKMIAFAEEARKAEEERIRKAIEEKEAEERRVKEEEERIKAEKEETERKSKEEAEKREAELQEKLRKEEERLARKKRTEEIMARTRGKGGANTPKKEVKEESVTSQSEQPASLDTNVDPTKPDLLGDISDKVEAENAKNLANSSTPPPSISSIPPSSSEAELEKGALDSISNKSEENENSSSLITIENGEEPVKKSNGIVEGVSFDQILDLDTLPDSNKAETEGLVGLPTPIIAFEESITQQNNTADLLS